MYVDVHNHILPGIDDGARNLEESLDMARIAVADGTDTMIAAVVRARHVKVFVINVRRAPGWRSAGPARRSGKIAACRSALDTSS